MPDAVARVAEEGFFRHVEIRPMEERADRRRTGDIVREHGLSLTMWLSLLAGAKGFNLSSPDERLRKKSIAFFKNGIEQAVESGATHVGLASGPDPGADFRESATEQLFTSLCELCGVADAFPGLRLVLEPMDRGAHKNGLIGPTREATALLDRIRPSCSNMGVCWDSAHVALCGEDIVESLAQAREYVFQVHLSNAVLDRTQPDFGDHHMKMGPPGFLTQERIAALFQTALDTCLFGESGPSVAAEIRSASGIDPWVTVTECARTLREAWERLDKERSPA